MQKQLVKSTRIRLPDRVVTYSSFWPFVDPNTFVFTIMFVLCKNRVHYRN